VEYLGWIIGGAVLCLPLSYAVFMSVAEWRAESPIKKRVAATRRTEVIDGKEFSVVTKTLPVVREKRTGRLGIALERGADSDATTVKGQMTLEPRWIRVQFVRKSDGKVGRIEWRRCAKFETVGTADVGFLTHRSGLFRTHTFIRYAINFKGL